jgi:hypothetical protein
MAHFRWRTFGARLDCFASLAMTGGGFAQPVIGRRYASTRWRLAMTFFRRCRCRLFARLLPALGRAAS